MGSYFTRILRLSFLAPEVVKTILRDRHPLEPTAKKLAGDTRLPIAWQEQRFERDADPETVRRLATLLEGETP